MAAGEGGARDVDEAAGRAGPVDRVLELVDADDDDRHAGDEHADLGPAPADGEDRRAQIAASEQTDRR